MSLSNRVHVTKHFFIALGDGTRLAARLWLQEGADATPVPAILEYIPYRKRHGTRGRDEPMHPGSPRSASICGLYHGNWGLREGATPIPGHVAAACQCAIASARHRRSVRREIG